MDKREKGSGGVGLLVGVLVLIAVAAGAYLFTSGDPGGIFSTGDEDAASESDADDASPEAKASYGWGEVVLEVERKKDAVSVFFVNEGRVTFADVVLRCVNRYRKDFDGVACYGFPSREAFEVAEVDPETGAMEKKCWQAYYSVSGRGKTERESAGAIAEGQVSKGCPIT